MRKKSDTILRLLLIVGDACALILSFAMAYFIRVKVDPRPWTFEFQFFEFVQTVVWLVPVMLVILAALGLYRKDVFLARTRMPERGRLVLAAVLGLFTETWVPIRPAQLPGLLWLGVVIDAVTYLLWALALKEAKDTAKIANMAFLTPFLSLVISAVFLKETLRPQAFLALVLIVGGILLQSLWEGRKQTA